MEIPYNEIFRSQQKKLVSSNLKRGIVSKIYDTSWTADVSIVGSPTSILKNVPISSTILPGNIKVGDRCKLDLFDESNPKDVFISSVYGRKGTFPIAVFSLKTFTISGPMTIPHSLGKEPDFISLNSAQHYSGSGGGYGFSSYYVHHADEVNIYIYNNGNANYAVTASLYAFILDDMTFDINQGGILA